jgi:hypothetical protein
MKHLCFTIFEWGKDGVKNIDAYLRRKINVRAAAYKINA